MIIKENNINVVFEFSPNQELYLLHMSECNYDEKLIDDKEKQWFRAIEIQTTGSNQDNHHALKNTGTSCGDVLKYQSHKDYLNLFGRKLEFLLKNEYLEVVLHYQFYDGIQIARTKVDVTNISNEQVGLEYISLFSLTGIDKEGTGEVNDKMEIMIPHNSWCGELAWKQYTLEELGYSKVRSFSLKRINFSNTGAWSTKEYLPMGYVHNKSSNQSLLWQIENNGSWQWEISDINDRLYLKLSGPNEVSHQWWKCLKPNETFTTATSAIVCVNGGFERAIGEMTKYRRVITRKNKSDSTLPIIFNDYMKCMLCDATTEKLLPVIDAAAEVGAEYFCIDAGWYSKKDWWSEAGDWVPNTDRFPNGITEVIDYIRGKDMKAGIWLEPEVVAINSPMAKQFSDDCFFFRHGKRIIDHGRYQLDFRNKKVTDYLSCVVDRFVNEYVIGYLKLDYNIEAGIGTELDTDSFGDGLLMHSRAYIKWVKDTMDKYPDLIIENCASGGMRMNYELLSLHSIQSVSDQEDYRLNAVISAAAATGLTPEQAAFWVYPSAAADENEIVYNMVNAMLSRMHLSGAIAKFSPEKMALVKEAIEYYKKIRCDIPQFTPFYPLGLPSFYDNWLCVGYRCENKAYLAVWRRHSDTDNIILPIDFKVKCANVAYPTTLKNNEVEVIDNGIKAILKDENSAMIIELLLDSI